MNAHVGLWGRYWGTLGADFEQRIWSRIWTTVSVVVGCRPPGSVDCAVDVVSEQCGEEIASFIRTLSSEVLEKIDCTKRKRQFIACCSVVAYNV